MLLCSSWFLLLSQCGGDREGTLRKGSCASRCPPIPSEIRNLVGGRSALTAPRACVCAWITVTRAERHSIVHADRCHVFFIRSPADGHSGHFHVLTIVNDAAMNIGMQVCFQTRFLFSPYPGVELLDRTVSNIIL